jgi:hypothetical protein
MKTIAAHAPKQLEETSMPKFAESWKAVLAFVSLVVTNLAVVLVQSGQPWPTNLKGWGTLAVTTLLGTWLVWAKSNKPAS